MPSVLYKNGDADLASEMKRSTEVDSARSDDAARYFVEYNGGIFATCREKHRMYACCRTSSAVRGVTQAAQSRAEACSQVDAGG